MKATVFITLLAAALSAPLAAQTLTEQLQKGIYTEEVLGNRDEAARIYRQILAAPAVPQAIAQDAERRLARLTAKRLRSVEIITSAEAAQLEGARKLTFYVFEDKPRGAVEQGRYRHFSSGITFYLPPGWIASETYASSDGGDMVTLTDETTRRSINVWMIKVETPADQIATQVAEAPAQKIRQRHSGYGIPGMSDDRTYDIPTETVQPTSINGQQAIVAVGTYLGIPPERLEGRGLTLGASAAAEPMHEYMTWIHSLHARAFFFARVPVADLPQLRPPFDQLVYSAIVP